MFLREMSLVLHTAQPDKCFKPGLHVLNRLYLQKQCTLIPHKLPQSLITLINTPRHVTEQSTDSLQQLKNTCIYYIRTCSFSVGKFPPLEGIVLFFLLLLSIVLLLTFQICPALSFPPRAPLLSYQFLSGRRSSDEFSHPVKTLDASS